MSLIVVLAAVVTVVAAVRSTWSPCGLSMLSTIVPLGERARGNVYAVTVVWFVLGALAGGVTLGLLSAGFAVGVDALDPAASTVLLVAALCSVVAAASDLRIGGFRFPAHRRQVDEVWLTGFRPWVYGLGFGWQIGVGLATFITTAAVYLSVVLAAATGSPWTALLLGVVFGVVRGLAVLLGVRMHTPDALRALHARLEALDPTAAWVTSSVLVAVAAIAATAWWPPAGAVVLVALLPFVLLRRPRSATVGRARAASSSV